jgi:hypothetical protein
VLSFTPLRWHSNIFEYDNLNGEKIEKTAGNDNSAVDDCCVPPKFSMNFLSAVMVRLRPILPAREPPHTTNSSPASPALGTQIWMIVEYYFHAIIIIFRNDDGIIGKRQRCVEGRPLLWRTREMAQQRLTAFCGPDAQLGSSAGLVA